MEGGKNGKVRIVQHLTDYYRTTRLLDNIGIHARFVLPNEILSYRKMYGICTIERQTKSANNFFFLAVGSMLLFASTRLRLWTLAVRTLCTGMSIASVPFAVASLHCFCQYFHNGNIESAKTTWGRERKRKSMRIGEREMNAYVRFAKWYTKIEANRIGEAINFDETNDTESSRVIRLWQALWVIAWPMMSVCVCARVSLTISALVFAFGMKRNAMRSKHKCDRIVRNVSVHCEMSGVPIEADQRRRKVSAEALKGKCMRPYRHECL